MLQERLHVYNKIDLIHSRVVYLLQKEQDGLTL